MRAWDGWTDQSAILLNNNGSKLLTKKKEKKRKQKKLTRTVYFGVYELSLKLKNVTYELELVHFNLCELNFELVLVSCELTRHSIHYTKV